MNIERTQNDPWQILTIREERLDAHNAQELKDYLQEIFSAGYNRLIIDLGSVRFIDSSGLGALVSGFKNAISRQGELRLCALQPQVRSMFELTRLHRVFEISPSASDALTSE